jgi:diaminohydroxyphosphoribosylaminopyrimidine deaminase/5-amino-6-(5-phosphoribosylamino)uracil reductase
VRVKLATSLDGRTALPTGESKWISSDAARADVQRWRARSGGLLTGIATVRADDPSLTVRLGTDEDFEPPVRIVLDDRGRLAHDCKLLTDGLAPTIAVHGEDVVPDYSDDVPAFAVRRNDQGLDLAAVLAQLAQRGIGELQVEAGATLSGALLRAGLVDEVLLYVAPVLLGERGRPLFAGVDPATMADRIGLTLVETVHVGPDLRLTLVPA